MRTDTECQDGWQAHRGCLVSTAVHVLQRVPSAAAAADGLRKDASTLRFFFFLSIRVKNSSLAERFPAVDREEDPAAQPPDPPGLLRPMVSLASYGLPARRRQPAQVQLRSAGGVARRGHAVARRPYAARTARPFLCAQVYIVLLLLTRYIWHW
eukprot:COSAG06_NODE_199_length_20418_cov_43.318421_7_plen_154_part_00